MRKIIGSLLFMCLMVSQYSQSWSYNLDCETGQVDQLPQSINGMNWGILSTITSSNYFSGSRSCRMAIKKGSEGWPSSGGPMEWGAGYSFPQKVKVGEEFWLRFALFVPKDFPIQTNTGVLKFIRLKTLTNTLTNTGYVDLLMGVPTVGIWNAQTKKDEYPPFVVNFEGRPGLTMIGQRPAHDVRKGVWETYEVYVKVDSVPVKGGGQGLMKIWKNNQLVVTLDNQVLVSDSTGKMDALLLFSYWNGTAPSDTYALLDDLVITTETPANQDSDGFAYIGGKVAVSPPGVPLLPSFR